MPPGGFFRRCRIHHGRGGSTLRRAVTAKDSRHFGNVTRRRDRGPGTLRRVGQHEHVARESLGVFGLDAGDERRPGLGVSGSAVVTIGQAASRARRAEDGADIAPRRR